MDSSSSTIKIAFFSSIKNAPEFFKIYFEEATKEFGGSLEEFLKIPLLAKNSPNGLFDLEDKLLIGNNAIRSDEAIRSFETQMKKLYNSFAEDQKPEWLTWDNILHYEKLMVK